MSDPCQWCDGKTVWNVEKWVQMSRCKEEEYCEYYKQFLRQKEEEGFWQSELEHGVIRPGIYVSDFIDDTY